MSRFQQIFHLYGSGTNASTKAAGDFPTATYCILITPRSGSTWLTREMARRDVLSTPHEYFNLEELPNGLKNNPACSLPDYFAVISNNLTTREGIFGFEIGYFDLLELEKEIALPELMVGDKYFVYLSRDDLIAQAVSLYIAYETSIFHSFGADGRVDQQRRTPVPYDRRKVKLWASHILAQEQGIEEWIGERRLPVLRVQYEDMLADVDGVVRRIADWIGVALPPGGNIDVVTTNRLSSERNEDYCSRFVHDESALCEEWSRNREKQGRTQCRRRFEDARQRLRQESQFVAPE